MNGIKPLPTGMSGFPELRESAMIYVDKTSLVARIAANRGFFFLSRPRRFGKTLLLSTFESLFRYGLRDFKGLEIEKIWDDPVTYPVIHLDFTACDLFSSIEEFKDSFDALLRRAAAGAGLIMPAVNARQGRRNTLQCFEDLLRDLKVPAVLLIDEYDHPLNKCLDNKELFEDVSGVLASFYSALKRVSPKLRFMFITGICKYRDLSAFTSGNYITDLSMDPEYGTLLGYTEDEIKSYFGSYLELAAGSLGIGVNECFEKLKSYYDGFCFDLASSTHVFVPWSVLSFLSAPKSGFMNYWFESGGRSTVLLNFMRNHSLRDPAEYGQDRVMSIMDVSSSRGIDDFSDVILLNQTGYLTIKRCEGFSLILNYPNEEVAESMALLYRNRLFGDRDPDSLFNLPVTSLFERYPVEEIPQKLNVIFKGLDYKNYPLKDEYSLRAYLQVYLYGLGGA